MIKDVGLPTASVVHDHRVVNPPGEVERRWRERYIPAQQLYFATAHPTDHADIIVHNDDPQQPVCEARST